jgi:predicted nuclease of predicted toxin-antitoxin system
VRLLLDENLSEAPLAPLADLFPDSLHVRALGRSGASDLEVWRLAQAHDCVLVTRDEDFVRYSVLRGAPPKVVWLAVGNCGNATLISLLRNHAADLREFAAQTETTFLVVRH